ncbi:hypothetical protein PR048_024986 [Dryococelus australis]|uniref:Uncharacterized protein n=1 Tax=Dryococelus australis TaxID=614101 RepID=A0ABQ9GQ39_9NEOP|nr:hypothetical protein PR048_024986 [Dryococelus australis]
MRNEIASVGENCKVLACPRTRRSRWTISRQRKNGTSDTGQAELGGCTVRSYNRFSTLLTRAARPPRDVLKDLQGFSAPATQGNESSWHSARRPNKTSDSAQQTGTRTMSKGLGGGGEERRSATVCHRGQDCIIYFYIHARAAWPGSPPLHYPAVRRRPVGNLVFSDVAGPLGRPASVMAGRLPRYHRRTAERERERERRERERERDSPPPRVADNPQDHHARSRGSRTLSVISGPREQGGGGEVCGAERLQCAVQRTFTLSFQCTISAVNAVLVPTGAKTIYVACSPSNHNDRFSHRLQFQRSSLDLRRRIGFLYELARRYYAASECKGRGETRVPREKPSTGGAVSPLASHQGEPGSITLPGHRIFACGNRAGRCRWSVGFFRGSPFSPALSFLRCSILTSVTLIGSRDLAVKSSLNIFTQSPLGFEPGSLWWEASILPAAERRIHSSASPVEFARKYIGYLRARLTGCDKGDPKMRDTCHTVSKSKSLNWRAGFAAATCHNEIFRCDPAILEFCVNTPLISYTKPFLRPANGLCFLNSIHHLSRKRNSAKPAQELEKRPGNRERAHSKNNSKGSQIPLQLGVRWRISWERIRRREHEGLGEILERESTLAPGRLNQHVVNTRETYSGALWRGGKSKEREEAVGSNPPPATRRDCRVTPRTSGHVAVLCGGRKRVGVLPSPAEVSCEDIGVVRARGGGLSEGDEAPRVLTSHVPPPNPLPEASLIIGPGHLPAETGGIKRRTHRFHTRVEGTRITEIAAMTSQHDRQRHSRTPPRADASRACDVIQCGATASQLQPLPPETHRHTMRRLFENF